MQMPRAALLWLDNGNIADAAVTIPELLQEAVEVTIKALAVSHILLVCKGKEKLVGSAAEIVIDKPSKLLESTFQAGKILASVLIVLIVQNFPCLVQDILIFTETGYHLGNIGNTVKGNHFQNMIHPGNLTKLRFMNERIRSFVIKN